MPSSPLDINGSGTASSEDDQFSRDAHLAFSMTQSTTRPRSHTLLNPSEMVTPQRERGSGGGAWGGGTSPTRGVDPPTTSGSGRRRGSIGGANTNTNTFAHLADDLEIQAHRDQVFFDRGASSPAGGPQRGFAPHPSAPGLQHSAAAARFYRQQRNLSESSIDSQGGAYIDHRRQPHSLAVNTSGGRGMFDRMQDRLGSAGIKVSSPIDYRTGGDGGGSRRQHSGGGDAMGDEFAPYRQRAPSPTSPSHAHARQDEDPSQSAISTRTARQGTLSTADLDGSAIDDDDSGRQSPRSHLERNASHKSYASLDSRPRDAMPEEREGDFLNELSRRGSPLGQPEADVCFPAHGASADVDLLLDLGMSGIGMYGHEDHPHHRHPHGHGGPGIPGVLHNFPFPFDFNALEEFADREKDGMPIPGASRRGNILLDDPSGSTSTSPPEYATSPRSRMMGGLSGSTGDGNFPTRRTMRQRKLSESVAPGRYQRKLALFEGAGEGGGVSAGGPRSNGLFSNIMDTKTPLLAGSGAGRGGGGGYGTEVPPSRGGPSAASGAARPYRFSFYSNALPSTIHARSLAEIPADGQTFEELFVGRTPMSEDEEGLGVNGAFSPPPSHGGTATGTSTPNLAGEMPNPNRASVNSARPAGVPLAGLANGGGGGGGARPKSSMMRTEIDAEANTWWLDVMCPTDAEMKVLSKVFGIHPLTTEDILMEETREKIELFRNYYFVCFRSFEQDPYSPTYLEPLNMYIIVFREGTLSFHFRGTPHPQNVRRRIKQLKDYINVTSDWISYALIDDITDAFGPLIQNIEYEVDSIDELVLILKEAEQSDMLRRIGTCRKKVMGLLRLMGNKADVVKGLSKRCNENWAVAPKSDIGLYLSDIQDHITTSTQNLTHYEKILSRSHSNYLAQISIEMTDANNQINDVLSKLTALGTVLIPMNLITGLWGMNVHVPGQEVENLHWFFGIVGGLAGIAISGAWLTYRVFVRQ